MILRLITNEHYLLYLQERKEIRNVYIFATQSLHSRTDNGFLCYRKKKIMMWRERRSDEFYFSLYLYVIKCVICLLCLAALRRCTQQAHKYTKLNKYFCSSNCWMTNKKNPKINESKQCRKKEREISFDRNFLVFFFFHSLTSSIFI